jgi:hypothetical protein
MEIFIVEAQIPWFLGQELDASRNSLGPVLSGGGPIALRVMHCGSDEFFLDSQVSFPLVITKAGSSGGILCFVLNP